MALPAPPPQLSLSLGQILRCRGHHSISNEYVLSTFMPLSLFKWKWTEIISVQTVYILKVKWLTEVVSALY